MRSGYIHIQKAGGTSFCNALRTSPQFPFQSLSHAYCYDIDDIYYFDRHYMYGQPILKWQAVFPTIKKDDWDFIFTLVRNPFDILKSYYWHTHPNSKGIDGWAFCNITHGFTSWDDFIEAYLEPNFKWHLPPMKDSMFSFIYDENGDRIIDHYLRIEDRDRINQFLASTRAQPMPQSNTSANKPTKSIYTPSQVQKLNQIWKKDLEYFGYQYDNQ